MATPLWRTSCSRGSNPNSKGKDGVMRSFLCVSIAAAAALAAIPAAAQSLPTNASLKGAYWVRYLGVNDGLGDTTVSFAGTVNFDGAGNFAVTGAGAAFDTASKPL